VLSGCEAAPARPDSHRFAAPDGQTALWFGDVDDLWKFGKPVGTGGPWHNSDVAADEPSDAYLMAGYDEKSVELSHDAQETVAFSLEVDLAADGTWLRYAKFDVPPGKPFIHTFPQGYSAHWVRLKADRACKASAVFAYR